MINPTGELADQMRDAFIDVAASYSSTFEGFDPDTRSVFAAVAKAVMARSTGTDQTLPDATFTDLGSLMATAFMAGREHALQGLPTPVARNADTGDVFVPTDW